MPAPLAGNAAKLHLAAWSLRWIRTALIAPVCFRFQTRSTLSTSETAASKRHLDDSPMTVLYLTPRDVRFGMSRSVARRELHMVEVEDEGQCTQQASTSAMKK